MVNEENIGEIWSDILRQKTKISKLAVASMVFGILAPFCFGAMWIVSFLPSHDLITASRYIMAAFSYTVAWILSLILGIKSLEQIQNSEERLVGRVYAVVGISISAVWMVLMVARFLLPALHSVNS
ncbi:MAG TPA: hypothetical protein VMY06_02520 [Sedimentisphaerales bacterium]|nr:hypothetical protein [Sedimentisphaerales bacterium]